MTPLLLLLLSSCSCHIPFYCKIRKTNCQLRPESSCCQLTYTTSATVYSTSSQDVTTLQSVDTSEGTVEETEDQESISSEELFEAEPSEIDEVFVKVTGEQIEVKCHLKI